MADSCDKRAEPSERVFLKPGLIFSAVVIPTVSVVLPTEEGSLLELISYCAALAIVSFVIPTKEGSLTESKYRIVKIDLVER